MNEKILPYLYSIKQCVMEMLLKIKSEKSADAIKSILHSLGIDVEMITTSADKAWLPGKPFSKEEIEERHKKSVREAEAGNFYTYDEVKGSIEELFKKHGHEIQP